jgi:V8-like Glu-specific endopeptidase
VLTGPEQLQWTDALFKTFTYTEFSNLLLRMDENIGEYGTPFKTVKENVGDVVAALSRRDRENELITAAVEWRPANAELIRIASRQGAVAAPDDAHLQRLIKDSNSLLNFPNWLAAAGAVQVCVCRIEIEAQGGGTIFGTGFLIADDLVMTNWHVIRGIIANEENDTSYTGARANASDVTCLFDYKVFPNGLKSKGTTFTLASDWLVALSKNNPATREPQADELDCAVIKLKDPAGKLPVGDREKKANDGDPRSFIKLPAQMDPALVFKEKTPLFIVQHPSGDPIKLALDTAGIQSVNSNRTRVQYSTNTEPGSSGSPCFNENWKLIALHHSGDPNFVEGTPPTFNQGIPIDSIVSFLVKKKVI